MTPQPLSAWAKPGRFAAVALAAVLASPWSAFAAALPAEVARQLPAGHQVLASAQLEAGRPSRRFLVLALGRRGESVNHAPPRPLMIFEHRVGGFVLVGRNDTVVDKADEGGQCDPFLDGEATIAVKGRYFTVENGVSCGQHWSDFITFRLDDRSGGFVFDNERSESWTLNPSQAPDAEALVRDGPQRVVRPRAGAIVPFTAWRPSR